MNKQEFKKLDREQMIIAFNQLKDDYTNLFNKSVSKDKIRAKIEEINSLKYKDERLDRASIDFVINKFYRLLEEE